jgi:hypothetical protein
MVLLHSFCAPARTWLQDEELGVNSPPLSVNLRKRLCATVDLLLRASPALRVVTMDAVEKANVETMKKYTKELKIGEGTYAVVYKGTKPARVAILAANTKGQNRTRSIDWEASRH